MWGTATGGLSQTRNVEGVSTQKDDTVLLDEGAWISRVLIYYYFDESVQKSFITSWKVVYDDNDFSND